MSTKPIPSARELAVDGRVHRIYLDGSGAPAVVFEPAIGDVGLTFGRVQPDVAGLTTAFTHDRPGLGDSAPADSPRTVDVLVDELRRTLAAAVQPPYVLVGHSFSSLIVQSFAYLHPGEVKGIVLIDGAHEDQMERFPAELSPRAMSLEQPTNSGTSRKQLARANRCRTSSPHRSPSPSHWPRPTEKPRPPHPTVSRRRRLNTTPWRRARRKFEPEQVITRRHDHRRHPPRCPTAHARSTR